MPPKRGKNLGKERVVKKRKGFALIQKKVKINEAKLKKTIIKVIGANELQISFGLEGINAKPNGKDIGNRQ